MVTQLPDIFNLGDIENKAILKACSQAHLALGRLNGIALTIPSPDILLSTLPLQEAKESSEIESIITTYDEMYQSNYDKQEFPSFAAKEVHNYAEAMSIGYKELKKTGLLTCTIIKKMQGILENNDAGFRKQMGTGLVNEITKELIYMPPQRFEDINHYMGQLERFINDSDEIDYDPLVKMAIIHHQFESIHPFYDGNGRTGRMLNILYLIQQNILDAPILYLSRYINRQKSDYYRLLQAVRDTGDWHEWLLFMVTAVNETADMTVKLVQRIKEAMQQHKETIKQHSKIYSHELINNLYKYPYTRIEFVAKDCNVHRNTASRYLEQLVSIGVLNKVRIQRDNFYVNEKLFAILSEH